MTAAATSRGLSTSSTGERHRIDARDKKLIRQLNTAVDTDPDFWSFQKNAVRQHAHGFFQYPAMMVPQMLARLIRDVKTVNPDLQSIYDPFVGSGTALTESMLQGLDFFGRDINPLAVLLCRVKSGPFFVGKLPEKQAALFKRIRLDNGLTIESKFDNWQKWFRRDVAIHLSRVVRSIRMDRSKWSRQFAWVALAETVRLVSNSRTSTFKLHTRPSKEILSRDIDVDHTFSRVFRRNVKHLSSKHALLNEMGLLSKGYYKGTVDVRLGDSREDQKCVQDQCDLVLTSPPYGDNATTVPYGQHSYLPLQWIDLEDIDPDVDDRLLASTHAIDTHSLGGSKKGALSQVQALTEKSEALRSTLEKLKDQPRDRSLRVAAFFKDLELSLDPILGRLKPGGYMIWIVGDRQVGNRRVPLHSILSELLLAKAAYPVLTLERRIPSKRMASRNSISETMVNEHIVVIRREGS